MSMNKNEFNSVLEEQSFQLVEIMGALNGLLVAEGVTSFEQDAISNFLTRYCRRMTRSKHCTESELFFPNVAICVVKPRYIYYRRL